MKANKVLCLVGPTATGKTKTALQLSKEYLSVLISADSRQVYRGMDIVTGKDHPQDLKLWGIDIVDPDEECSVSVWYEAVSPALSQNKLPIIVGGTGLYIKALTEGIGTMKVPPNPKLRKELAALSLTELQQRLQSVNPSKFVSLNNSDVNNPRRLVRAIEIALSSPPPHPTHDLPDTLIIGLSHPDASLYRSVVEKRVLERLRLGAAEETKRLVAKYARNLPSMTAIGYSSIIKYLAGELNKEAMIDQWTLAELQYSKRQMTWFKKVPHIVWFDVEDKKRDEKIAKLVSIWYAKR